MTPWLVLQLADSAFPTGGFAHSAGLEAAVQLGEIDGAAGLRSYVEQSLWALGHAGLPFVRASHREPEAVVAHDALCEAFLGNHVARRASRTQGRALLATVSEVFPRAGLSALERAVRARALRGHHAPVFGATTRALEIEWSDAAQLFMHQGLRTVSSAAVRLGVVGPQEAQRVIHELAPLADRVLERCADLAIEDAAQPAPLLDVLGATHDRLYARLFQS
jgi:urease accessory protein